ncbi:hypothetical protein RFI_20009, partial [Reticulomyxa filosa]
MQTGILKSTRQVTKEQLQKSIVKDSLKQEMKERIEPDELMEADPTYEIINLAKKKKKGILKTPLQAVKEQLQKSQTKDQLKYEIEDRADLEEVTQSVVYFFFFFFLLYGQVREKKQTSYTHTHTGVLKTPMQAAREQLRKSQAKDVVKNDLNTRSEIAELEESG